MPLVRPVALNLKHQPQPALTVVYALVKDF